MTIETKYNIGDEVWVHNIFTKDIIKGKVLSFTITAAGKCTSIIYYVTSDKWFNPCSFQEQLLFPTKEELLNSL